MHSLQQLIEFGKTQASYHQRKAVDAALKPHQTKKHTQAGEWASEVVTLLESLPSELDPGIKTERDNIFSLDPFRLSDIPDTLVEELKISRADKMDAQVMELFRIAQRPLNISEVLVGLYRKFDVTEKRPALSARLYRLTQADQLESSEGARGTYQLVQKQKPAGKAGFQVSEAT